MAKTTTPTLHRCGDCAHCTPVTDVHRLLSIRGEPTMGTCPYWTLSRCTLLSWLSDCPHFKQRHT